MGGIFIKCKYIDENCGVDVWIFRQQPQIPKEDPIKLYVRKPQVVCKPTQCTQCMAYINATLRLSKK